MMIEVKSELFVAEELASINGYSWTLASRLGDALEKAEMLFGDRDKEYTILGVEFLSTEVPQIWYAGSGRHIAIQLSREALGDANQAFYQLAHEVVHCLSPTGAQGANVLEEGLAVWFSRWYMKTSGLGDHWNATLESYLEAGRLVEQLLKIDMGLIKRLRGREPVLSQATPGALMKLHGDVEMTLAEGLCETFCR